MNERIGEYISKEDTIYSQEVIKFPADVQLVEHGKWIYPYEDKDINQCSECRSYVQDKISNVREMFAYCPYCGAKMDGGMEEND